MKKALFLCSVCKKHTKTPVKEFELEAEVKLQDDPNSIHWRYWMSNRAVDEIALLGEYANFSGDDYWLDVVCLDDYWKPFWESIAESNSFIFIEILVEKLMESQPTNYYRELLTNMIETNDLDECHAIANDKLGNMEKVAQIREFQKRKGTKHWSDDKEAVRAALSTKYMDNSKK